MKMFIVWQKVASYSEYLVEVDFLRIYTHINIYCKSISFCFDSLRLSDCSWTDNMHGFFSWVTLSFLCVQTKRTKKLLCVFFLSLSSSFSPLCSFFSRVIYACLQTVSIYSFFFSVTVIFTSSLDALTMQTHSSFNHVYSFSTLTTIVYCHRGIHGNLGTKHKPTLFGGEARLEYKEP